MKKTYLSITNLFINYIFKILVYLTDRKSVLKFNYCVIICLRKGMFFVVREIFDKFVFTKR